MKGTYYSNPPWREDFDLNDGYGHWSDLASSSAEWDYIPSPGPVLPVSVDPDIVTSYDGSNELGLAYSELGNQAVLSASAVMTSDDTCVPSTCFDNNIEGDKKNWWVAILDFYATTDPSSNPHVDSCIRGQPIFSQNNATRFCAIMEIDKELTACGMDQACGGLQITGQHILSGIVTGYVYRKPLKWAPVDKMAYGHLFRAQIHERIHDNPTRGWELEWAAEWWDLGTMPNQDQEVFLGLFDYDFKDLEWVNEHQILWDHYILVPSLAGSRFGFGLAYGFNGGIGTERVATTCIRD
jgi:hypothetical protein